MLALRFPHPTLLTSPADAHSTRPWDLIYPQRDGRPFYNPGGKYAVKLFWMGACRKITVDDALPFDESGACLIIQSPIERELWPSIICKAVLKIVQLTYETAYEVPDFGEADMLQMLTGWLPVTYQTQPTFTEQANLLKLLEEQHQLMAPLTTYEPIQEPPSPSEQASSVPGNSPPSVDAFPSESTEKRRHADPTQPKSLKIGKS